MGIIVFCGESRNLVGKDSKYTNHIIFIIRLVYSVFSSLKAPFPPPSLEKQVIIYGGSYYTKPQLS